MSYANLPQYVYLDLVLKCFVLLSIESIHIFFKQVNVGGFWTVGHSEKASEKNKQVCVYSITGLLGGFC